MVGDDAAAAVDLNPRTAPPTNKSASCNDA
jgi:hypothetical protein